MKFAQGTATGILFAAAFLLLVQTGGVFANDTPAASAPAFAAGTAFTYQGRLEIDGVPADGEFDFQFQLFDAAVGAVNPSAIVSEDGLGVTNGVFSSLLNFGPGAFSGQKRFIEVRVRPGVSSGSFTTLPNRQELTPAPYALFAANTWGLNGNAGTQQGTNFIGTTDNQALHIRTNNTHAARFETNGAAIFGSANNAVGVNATLATIGAGLENTIFAPNGFIGGGATNRIGLLSSGLESPNSVIGGGSMNSIAAIESVVGGGTNNRIHDNYSFVGGGTSNVAGTNDANRVDANYAVIVGGESNQALDEHTFVGGGSNNIAAKYFAVVVGGEDNHANQDYSAIVSGNDNTITGEHAFIGAGDHNTAGSYSSIVGGQRNITASGGFIGGGEDNAVTASLGVIAGGDNNEAGLAAFVGGGEQNRAAALDSVVAGGKQNSVTGPYGVIGGGGPVSDVSGFLVANEVTDTLGVVGGGGGNRAGDQTGTTNDAQGATVGGGVLNRASGAYSTIPGGFGNFADGNFSFAGGRRVRAAGDGTFAWADSQNLEFLVNDADTFAIRAQGGVGVNLASPQESLDVQGDVRIRPNANNNILLTASGSAGDLGIQYIKSAEPTEVSAEIRFDGFNSATKEGSIRFFTRNFPDALKEILVLDAEGDILPGDNSFSDSTGNRFGVPGQQWREVHTRKLFVDGDIFQASDARLKKNIEDLDLGLDAVMQLRPVSYEWKEGSAGEQRMGLIAQEIQRVLPGVVHVPVEDGGHLSVNYSELIPLLIKAIQEQEAKIEAVGTTSGATPAPQATVPGFSRFVAAGALLLAFVLGAFTVAMVTRAPRRGSPTTVA